MLATRIAHTLSPRMSRIRVVAAAFSLFAMVALFSVPSSASPSQPELSNQLYLPLVQGGVEVEWFNPLSAETLGNFIFDPTVQMRIDEIQMQWVRVSGLRWNDVQPEEGGPLLWDHPQTVNFEQFLIGAQALGIDTTVIIQYSPIWATVEPSHCAAIREDKMDDFANFVAAVVDRYKVPPYNVHSWELFNEPDVDPSLVGADSGFGCWGDIDDPYYGGERYGEMLQAIAPVIRAAAPTAEIVFGGLLLGAAVTTDPARGHPERFFEGALLSGAGDSFDILGYHVHHVFLGQFYDYGGATTSATWNPWGGMTKGKPAFLRNVMATYNVDKPLWMNEGTLRCSPEQSLECEGGASGAFLITQGRHVPREVSRTLGADVERFSWYTLQWSLWDECGLLYPNHDPRPSFIAYQTFIETMEGATFPPDAVAYGGELEAYRFHIPGQPLVDVVFSPRGVSYYASIPVDKFVAAYNTYGLQLQPPPPIDGNYNFLVGYEAIYFHRTP